MAYFPFFIDLEGVNGLIVGGGTVALRKVEKLIPYGPRLTVVAPEILPQISDIPNLILRRRSFLPEDLLEQSFVIAAAGNRDVNHEISVLCRRESIPVNVVDNKEESSFLFPSLIRRGSLSVGISTSGDSPSAAIYCKEQFSRLLPSNLEEILCYLGLERQRSRQLISQPHHREQLMKALFEACLEAGRPLNEQETDRIRARWTEEVRR